MKQVFTRLRNNVAPLLWIAAVVAGAWYWCKFLAGGDAGKMRLVLALVASMFSIGTAFGFLFSSYGEEQSTIGKIRDWLIGGITGVGLAEAIEQGGTIKKILQKFQFASTDSDFALVIGTAIAFTTLGFFFMYFQRELIFNISLAAKRAERGRIDGTHHAGIVIQRTLSVLPASMLTGVDDIDEIAEVAPEEEANLRSILYSNEVEEFLRHANSAIRDGMSLDWDVISKVAYVHYYRTYFEPKEKKPAQIKQATEWLLRALAINPLHADLTMKYADMLITNKEYEEAAAILERLSFRPEAPALVKQWLGYVLLFIPQRVTEGVKYSESFHREFPNHQGSLLNAACGYAQLYCSESNKGMEQNKQSENRKKALAALRGALNAEPAYVTSVASNWTQKGQDFECLKTDEEFLELISEFKQRVHDSVKTEAKGSSGK